MSEQKTILPAEKQKADFVRDLFARIANSYDLMNDLITFGLHRLWKRESCRLLQLQKKDKVLDLATGTGDLAFCLEEISKKNQLELEITAVDFSKEMLAVAERKKREKNSQVNFLQADILSLGLPAGAFNKVIISYGLRNLKNYQAGLAEIWRVSAPKSRLVILDLSYPSSFFESLTKFYRFKLLPLVGKLLVRDREAYDYLVNSIYLYLNQVQLKELLEKNNWQEVKYKNLLGGLCVIHSAEKQAA